MPTVVACSCGQQVQVRDDWQGRPVRCPVCGGVLTVPSAVTAVPPPPLVPPAATADTPRLPAPLPPATGRVLEVWTQANVLGIDNLTVLTEYAIGFARLPKPQLKETKALLQRGARVVDTLGPALRLFPLAVLRAVQVDNGAATLSLGYLDGTRRAVHTVQF